MYLIGHGYWGEKIYQTLRKIVNEEIVVFDKFPTSDPEIKVNSIEQLNDYLSNLNSPNYFFIVTPEQTHFPLVKKLLLAKQHVFVEKPLSLTKVEANELVLLAQRNNSNLFVDRIFLYDQGYQLVKRLLTESNIGAIQRIESIRHSENIRKTDISVFDDLAPHDIYLAKDLLGAYPDTQQVEAIQTIDQQIVEGKIDWKVGNINWENWYSWNTHRTERTIKIIGEKGEILWKKNSPRDLIKVTVNTFSSDHIADSVIPSDNEGSEACTPTDSSDYLRMTEVPQSPSTLELVIQDFLNTSIQETNSKRKDRYQEYIDEVAVLESIRVQSSTL